MTHSPFDRLTAHMTPDQLAKWGEFWRIIRQMAESSVDSPQTLGYDGDRPEPPQPRSMRWDRSSPGRSPSTSDAA
jgi:hypothetical protein